MPGLIPILLAVLAGTVPGSRFPAAAPDDAWTLLPRENPPLPAWARVLVRPLPKATGALLELDRLHRADNPLGAKLAAKLRWLVADALGCEYARASALADLTRAGAGAGEVRRLTDGRPAPDEEKVFAFARQVTTAAYLVTDHQFANLVEQFGPEKMTAVVHTLAFANFHDRVILALGVKSDPGGPVPPLAVKLDADRRAKVPSPPRPPWDKVTAARPAKTYDAPTDWKDVPFAELEKRLADQKARSPRVPFPNPGRADTLPPGLREQARVINWTKIMGGYQPEMTAAWFNMYGEFRQEAKLDRVFGSTLFWVVTRANDCFY
jgi:alkylhydroperoxidase family enzyme